MAGREQESSKRPAVSEEVAAFGRRVRQLRLHAGLNQKQLEDKAGLSNGMVSLIEHGVREVGVGKVWLLARALGKKPADLFDAGPPTEDESR